MNITQPSKNEILPFTMTWLELDGIMLSEISQPEKDNTTWFHSHAEFKKKKKTAEHRGREGKIKNENGEGDKSQVMLNSRKQKRAWVAGGRWVKGWGNWVMGIKKGMWCDEPPVLYVTDESLNSTFETNLKNHLSQMVYFG